MYDSFTLLLADLLIFVLAGLLSAQPARRVPFEWDLVLAGLQSAQPARRVPCE
jgi:hypothetical protein